MLTLRPYQDEAVARSEAATARGVLAQLGVMATGGGKTAVFSTIIRRRGGRALVLAHRDELLDGARRDLLAVWPEADVGVVKAERNEVHAQVVLASVQTLARGNRLAQLMAPWTDPGLLSAAEPFTTVVVDEAHHVQEDNSYGAILAALRAGQRGTWCRCMHSAEQHPMVPTGGDDFTAACAACACRDYDGVGLADGEREQPPGPLLLGVTATPDRGDNRGLDDVFSEVVFAYDTLYLIRAGYLADVRGRRVKVAGLDLSDVKVRAGELDQGQTGAAMEKAHYHDQVVKAWLAEAVGRPTLVFTPTVETARLVAEAFTGAGVPAIYVHGGTPADERRDLLRPDGRFERGDYQVVANCAVLTEGTNLPWVSCVVPPLTKSRGKYAQCVGRGLRLYPGKDDCLVLDLVGATEDHSLVSVPSLFGLEKAHAKAMHAGERHLSVVAQERDDELVRLGLMAAEDADLFREMRGQGIAWVQVHKTGDTLRRYVRTLGKAADGTQLPTVVLAQRGPETWTAGLWWPAGKKGNPPERKAVLLAEVDIETAQAVADDFVRKNARMGLTDAEAKWRKGKPRRGQLVAAKQWRMKVDPKWTAGQLSDALDAHIARIKGAPAKR